MFSGLKETFATPVGGQDGGWTEVESGDSGGRVEEMGH